MTVREQLVAETARWLVAAACAVGGIGLWMALVTGDLVNAFASAALGLTGLFGHAYLRSAR